MLAPKRTANVGVRNFIQKLIYRNRYGLLRRRKLRNGSVKHNHLAGSAPIEIGTLAVPANPMMIVAIWLFLGIHLDEAD